MLRTRIRGGGALLIFVLGIFSPPAHAAFSWADLCKFFLKSKAPAPVPVPARVTPPLPLGFDTFLDPANWPRQLRDLPGAAGAREVTTFRLNYPALTLDDAVALIRDAGFPVNRDHGGGFRGVPYPGFAITLERGERGYALILQGVWAANAQFTQWVVDELLRAQERRMPGRRFSVTSFARGDVNDATLLRNYLKLFMVHARYLSDEVFPTLYLPDDLTTRLRRWIGLTRDDQSVADLVEMLRVAELDGLVGGDGAMLGFVTLRGQTRPVMQVETSDHEVVRNFVAASLAIAYQASVGYWLVD